MNSGQPFAPDMHVPLAYARGTLRFSVGRFTTADEIDRAIAAIARALAKLG
ncbi:MAG: hypothetical protein ACP5G7_08605 [Anaerolineae bacterium]